MFDSNEFLKQIKAEANAKKEGLAKEKPTPAPVPAPTPAPTEDELFAKQKEYVISRYPGASPKAKVVIGKQDPTVNYGRPEMAPLEDVIKDPKLMKKFFDYNAEQGNPIKLDAQPKKKKIVENPKWEEMDVSKTIEQYKPENGGAGIGAFIADVEKIDKNGYLLDAVIDTFSSDFQGMDNFTVKEATELAAKKLYKATPEELQKIQKYYNGRKTHSAEVEK